VLSEYSERIADRIATPDLCRSEKDSLLEKKDWVEAKEKKPLLGVSSEKVGVAARRTASL